VGGCEARRCGGPVFIALGCSKQGRGEIWRRIQFGGNKEENPADVGRKKETLTRGATVSAKEGEGKRAREKLGQRRRAGLGPREERVREGRWAARKSRPRRAGGPNTK
jgi:hypothetical protein